MLCQFEEDKFNSASADTAELYGKKNYESLPVLEQE